jgi:hypothetical protein
LEEHGEKLEKLINLSSQDRQKGNEDARLVVAAVLLSSASNIPSLRGNTEATGVNQLNVA